MCRCCARLPNAEYCDATIFCAHSDNTTAMHQPLTQANLNRWRPAFSTSAQIRLRRHGVRQGVLSWEMPARSLHSRCHPISVARQRSVRLRRLHPGHVPLPGSPGAARHTLPVSVVRNDEAANTSSARRDVANAQGCQENVTGKVGTSLLAAHRFSDIVFAQPLSQ